MNPQPAPRSDIAAFARPIDPHLTEDQFGDLLASASDTADPSNALAEAHVLACEQCAGELASLRESIDLFRHATSAYADSQLRNLSPVSIPARSMLSPALAPAYWAAAAAIFLAAFLPMQVLRQRSLQTVPPTAASVADHPTQSDEALLEDINREVSASVPTPMQALADPGAAMEAPLQNSTQRKD
jgi:hypothetical protein